MAESKHAKWRREARKRYDEYASLRGERCWICASTPKTRRLHLDHDHATMTFRGLLCFRCNNGLPYWATSEWLRAAADYLDSAPYEAAA